VPGARRPRDRALPGLTFVEGNFTYTYLIPDIVALLTEHTPMIGVGSGPLSFVPAAFEAPAGAAALRRRVRHDTPSGGQGRPNAVRTLDALPSGIDRAGRPACVLVMRR
jgi:hypothetical protein